RQRSGDVRRTIEISRQADAVAHRHHQRSLDRHRMRSLRPRVRAGRLGADADSEKERGQEKTADSGLRTADSSTANRGLRTAYNEFEREADHRGMQEGGSGRREERMPN